jgi:hypothetical protein
MQKNHNKSIENIVRILQTIFFRIQSVFKILVHIIIDFKIKHEVLVGSKANQRK